MKWLIANIKDFKAVEFEEALHGLSISRKNRILSFKRPEDIKRSLAGEVLIKRILADSFNINAVIECDEKGKPFVLGEEIYISISHSGDLVFCAADKEPLGVDIEKIKPIDFKVAKKFATEEELEYIGNSLERFYEIWTAKEAYYKMEGKTAVEFKSFCVFDIKRKIIKSEEYFAQIITKREG